MNEIILETIRKLPSPLDKISYNQWAQGEYTEVPKEELRMQIVETYQVLKEMVNDLPVSQHDRVVQYLNGKSLEEISGNRTRQAVGKTLDSVRLKWGWNSGHLEKARLIWIYAQLYIEG